MCYIYNFETEYTGRYPPYCHLVPASDSVSGIFLVLLPGGPIAPSSLDLQFMSRSPRTSQTPKKENRQNQLCLSPKYSFGVPKAHCV